MSAEWVEALLRASVVFSVAVIAVLLVRAPMRRLAGSGVAYALWAVVPLALVFSVLPSPRAMGVDVPGIALPEIAVSTSAASGSEPAGSAWLPALAWLWAFGFAVSVASSLWRQSRYLRALGPLRARPDGTVSTSAADAGPAVIGMLRARIVLPEDFEQRYSDEERELILQHERVHILRGDLIWNALAALLGALHWFNPLAHLALRRFRYDQEISADAVVLARRPHARRRYADAMLKTQLTHSPSPLGCHWQSDHPLKERIRMLKTPIPGVSRRIAGIIGTLVLSLCVAGAAWAMQPVSGAPLDEPVTYARVKPPKYPKSAFDDRREGKVQLAVEITPEGTAGKVEVMSSSGMAELDEAAAAAVAGWTFNPGKRDGVAVRSWIVVPVAFSLTDQAPGDQTPGPAPIPAALDEIHIRPRS